MMINFTKEDMEVGAESPETPPVVNPTGTSPLEQPTTLNSSEDDLVVSTNPEAGDAPSPDTLPVEPKADGEAVSPPGETKPPSENDKDEQNVDQKVEQRGADLLQERLDSRISALQAKNAELQGKIEGNNREIEHLQAAKQVDPEVAATIVHVAAEAPLDQAA